MTSPSDPAPDHALASLVRSADEAASMPAPLGSGQLDRVGDVVRALADASLAMRLAYWGYPHPGSVGDRPLVIRVDGREYAVARIAFEDDRLQVDVEPR